MTYGNLPPGPRSESQTIVQYRSWSWWEKSMSGSVATLCGNDSLIFKVNLTSSWMAWVEKDLASSSFIRSVLWVYTTLALVGNLVVVIWRYISRKREGFSTVSVLIIMSLTSYTVCTSCCITYPNFSVIHGQIHSLSKLVVRETSFSLSLPMPPFCWQSPLL